MNEAMRRDKLRLTDNWLAKHGQGVDTDGLGTETGEKRGKTKRAWEGDQLFSSSRAVNKQAERQTWSYLLP